MPNLSVLLSAIDIQENLGRSYAATDISQFLFTFDYNLSPTPTQPHERVRLFKIYTGSHTW